MSEISEIIIASKMPEGAADYCEEVFARIKSDPELFSLLETAESRFMMGFDSGSLAAKLSEKTGFHRYTIDLILMLYSCLRLHRLYKANGYSDEIFYATVPENLGYNTELCMKLHGIIGNFAFNAYRTMVSCTRFCLGRLHFELTRMPFDYKDICKKGQMVLSCHIPASGPLLLDEVEESFKLAYDFFKFSGPMVMSAALGCFTPASTKRCSKRALI